jgi:hypothetical protein
VFFQIGGSRVCGQALLSANSCWRRSRQDELDPCSLAGSAVQIEPTAQAIRDDVVDDMKTEASVPLIAAGREERIEGFTPDIETHAAAVVGKNNFDIVLSGGQHLYTDGTSLALGKRMRDRVEKEVGQHLSVWSRIAVHRQIALALDNEGQIFSSHARPQAHGDLFSQITDIEDALIRVVSVRRDLLERLDQFGGMI